ncbi:GntR family transcriptional regulator [Pseudochelatococcus sp. B33]
MAMLKESSGRRQRGPVRRPARLGDEAYDAIYEWIMSLKIPPGGRIAVDSLARELGISQTPIREALSRLEAEGLVVKTHLVGYSAAGQIDRRRFDELYELRLLLEPFAAGRAVESMTDEAMGRIEALHHALQGMDALQSRQAYSEFARLDGTFHQFIASLGRNSLVEDALNRLHTHIHLFRLAFHARATTDANGEHERIIAALRAGDGRGAEEAMREHLIRSRDRFVTAFMQ